MASGTLQLARTEGGCHGRKPPWNTKASPNRRPVSTWPTCRFQRRKQASLLGVIGMSRTVCTWLWTWCCATTNAEYEPITHPPASTPSSIWPWTCSEWLSARVNYAFAIKSLHGITVPSINHSSMKSSPDCLGQDRCHERSFILSDFSHEIIAIRWICPLVIGVYIFTGNRFICAIWNACILWPVFQRTLRAVFTPLYSFAHC